MLCNICGKEFEPKHFNQKLCSEECKQQARRNSIEKYKNFFPIEVNSPFDVIILRMP